MNIPFYIGNRKGDDSLKKIFSLWTQYDLLERAWVSSMLTTSSGQHSSMSPCITCHLNLLFAFPSLSCPQIALHRENISISSLPSGSVQDKYLYVYFCTFFLKIGFYVYYCCVSPSSFFVHYNLSWVVYCQRAPIFQIRVFKGNMLVWSSLIEDTYTRQSIYFCSPEIK